LNGVKAKCTSHKSGGTVVALTIGLKIDSTLLEGKGDSLVVLPMMTATVNEQEEVIANDEFDYRVVFNTGDAKKYSSVELEQLVPANARLVISLKPVF
jgi:hypothetical protein